MVLKILLILSIILQFVAAATAIRLMRMTKYNFSWILFTIALTVMSVIRCAEYIQIAGDKELKIPDYFLVWLGVVTSLCFAVGVLYVKKIFNYINRLDSQRRLTEKRILNTVLRTEEKERLRFSKELHDGLGPLLSSAKMSLSALKRDDNGGISRNGEIIDNANYAIEEAIHSLREISNNLSPHILNDFGLSRGISNFINKLSPKKIRVNYATELGNERFDTDTEVIVYRVICELINNSIKHSEGTEINLSIKYRGDLLIINYSDNGKGFDTTALKDMGMGLSNISTRISSINGISEIFSGKGQGMRAHITVNLKQEDGRRKV